MASSLQGSSISSLPLTDSVAVVDHGYVDGGWWPRSLELAVELPPFLEEVLAAGFDITEVYVVSAPNAADAIKTLRGLDDTTDR